MPSEQCRWVQMHNANMCFNSHLHSNNRREEKLCWTTVNGHSLAIYTILNLQTGTVWKWIGPRWMNKKENAKHIERFFRFEFLNTSNREKQKWKKKIYISKNTLRCSLVVVYHSHFSGFNVRSSRSDSNGFNRAQNIQFAIFIFAPFSRSMLAKFLISVKFPY